MIVFRFNLKTILERIFSISIVLLTTLYIFMCCHVPHLLTDQQGNNHYESRCSRKATPCRTSFGDPPALARTSASNTGAAEYRAYWGVHYTEIVCPTTNPRFHLLGVSFLSQFNDFPSPIPPNTSTIYSPWPFRRSWRPRWPCS